MNKKLLLGLSLLGLVTFASCGGEDSKKSSSVEISSVEESSIEVSSEQESNSVEEVSKIDLSVEESSLESSVEESTTSAQSTPKEGQNIVTKDQYIDAIKGIECHPQDLGYVMAQVEYNMDVDGEKSNGLWFFIYDSAENKWKSDDGKADEYAILLNYTLGSRVGNPFDELTFYTNPYAVAEVGDGYSAYFDWDNEGKIAEFNPVDWANFGTSTFKFTYSKGIK